MHHAHDPVALLREAKRVSQQAIVIKDHLSNGFLAARTLHFMDNVGNKRIGTDQVYDYWPREKWHAIISTLGLKVDTWIENLSLYPWPLTILFDRSLHFIAKLSIPNRTVVA